MKNYLKQILKVREQILSTLVNWSKPIYGQFFKKNNAWIRNLKDLKAMPKNSLGFALAEFLESENFDLMDKFEDHDVMHVIFDFKTTVLGEARMQFFLLGNGKRSLYVIISAIIAMVTLPENIHLFKKEFLTGKSCNPISKWDFQFLLLEELDILKKMIKGDDFQAKPIFF